MGDLNRRKLLLNFIWNNELLTTYDHNEISLAFLRLKDDKRELYEWVENFAIKKGFIACDLKGLRSKSGEPFIEEKDTLYRKASTQCRAKEEIAHFCSGCKCWVIGEPSKRIYKLNGEPGIRYKCKICDSCIGDNHD